MFFNNDLQSHNEEGKFEGQQALSSNDNKKDDEGFTVETLDGGNLKINCDRCDYSARDKRDMRRHINAVHLKIK